MPPDLRRATSDPSLRRATSDPSLRRATSDPSLRRATGDPSLRRATSDDVQAVERVVQRAYGHYVSRIGRAPGPMLDDYGALIAAARVHVAEPEGTVMGVLVLIPECDAMLLDNIAVDPEAQGKGLGRLMLAFAEQAAREAGYVSIRLYTHEAMTENIGLYGRTGYAETHRGEEKGFNRVYMTKALVDGN